LANDLIVNGGLDEILNRLVGLSPASALFCAVGTGNAAPTGAETALGAETARVPVSTVQVSGAAATLKAFFNTAQGNGMIGEHGLFTAAIGGVMLDKGIQAPTQVKPATQEMVVEKVITLERS
jgi:hypothetical protein